MPYLMIINLFAHLPIHQADILVGI